jgi:hypothetical protein
MTTNRVQLLDDLPGTTHCSSMPLPMPPCLIPTLLLEANHTFFLPHQPLRPEYSWTSTLSCHRWLLLLSSSIHVPLWRRPFSLLWTVSSRTVPLHPFPWQHREHPRPLWHPRRLSHIRNLIPYQLRLTQPFLSFR